MTTSGSKRCCSRRPPDLPADQRPMPDWAWVHRELRRPDVTLALLWEEYRAGARRRVRLFLVLRSLPGLGRPAEADDAPDPCRRREAVRRFRRPHRRGDRSLNRRDRAGADLRRRARRLQLHLRRGDLEPEAAGLDRARMSAPSPISAAPRGRRSATISRPASPRPASTSRWSTGPTPTWRGITAPPSSRRAPTSRATKPKSRSAFRSSGAGSWRGCGIGASSRWPSSTPRSARCSTISTIARCAAGARSRRAAVRAARPPGAAAPAARALRIRRVEALPGRPRLPRRDRQALLQRAAPADPPGGRGADHRRHGRDLPSRQAGRQPSPQHPPAPADHRRRAHAQFAPALSRLDA